MAAVPRTPTGPVLVAVVCAVLFGALALVVSVRDGAPLPGDGAVHVWTRDHRTSGVVALARDVTATGTTLWPYLLALAAGLTVGRTPRGRLRGVVCAVLVLVCGQAVRFGLMELIARARPDTADRITRATNFSFPSGHASTSALAPGVMCCAVTYRAAGTAGGGRRALARTVCVLALCWAAAVGLTRVYLGVHWPSDVLGGWLFAAAWLAASVAAYTVRSRPPGARPDRLRAGADRLSRREK
jgi:membrane-associated phospholipid phosphatase